MRSEQEIQQLKDGLDKLTGFIADYGPNDCLDKDEMTFANDMCDALSWVLEEISTEDLRGDQYLNIASLMVMSKQIEQQDGVTLDEYE